MSDSAEYELSEVDVVVRVRFSIEILTIDPEKKGARRQQAIRAARQLAVDGDLSQTGVGYRVTRIRDEVLHQEN